MVTNTAGAASARIRRYSTAKGHSSLSAPVHAIRPVALVCRASQSTTAHVFCGRLKSRCLLSSAASRLTCNKINTAMPETNARINAVDNPRSARPMSPPCALNQVWQLGAGQILCCGPSDELMAQVRVLTSTRVTCTPSATKLQTRWAGLEGSAPQTHNLFPPDTFQIPCSTTAAYRLT
jgi:hypothetical protein